MKDLKLLLIYSGATLAVILFLNYSVKQEISSGTLVLLSVLAVVVIPVIISLRLAKRERSKNNQDAG